MDHAAAFTEQLLSSHRSYLVRFATARLQDGDLAQDAVQDTLLAALESAARFAGKSSLKTWLTAILKHKIIDLRRRHKGEIAMSDLQAEPADGDRDAWASPDQAGPWEAMAAQRDWGNPEKTLEYARFWTLLQSGLEQLPEKTARALVMRELMGLSTDEICKELAISATNCWVILHRARQSLRSFLLQHDAEAGQFGA
jgi:RNA polymerase sigma-70 factor (ECF subfamily)